MTESSASTGEPLPKGLCDLPCELLLEIAEHLTPEPEAQLNKSFSPLMNCMSGREANQDLDLAKLIPSIDDIRNHGAQEVWDLYKSMNSLAMGCKQIHNFTTDALYRVVILYTGRQLARFFYSILLQPHRREEVRVLQLHQFLFTYPEVKAFEDELAKIGPKTDWRFFEDVHLAYHSLGHWVEGHNPSLTVMASMVLLHFLPNVTTLCFPYPQSLFGNRHHPPFLNWTAPEDILVEHVDLHRFSLPESMPDRYLRINFSDMEESRLKHLQLDAIVHHQTIRFRSDGSSASKPPKPVRYWKILGTSSVFKGLETLELHRIADPLAISSADLRLPNLKVLKLHSMKLDEAELLKMLPATPQLEVLEVWFTMNRRQQAVSDSQQQLLDNNLHSFPPGLRKLSIAYLLDPTPSTPATPLAYQAWTTTMKPRMRFNNLATLENLKDLSIDISSLVSTPSRAGNILSPLPPRLQRLRVFSATSITHTELRQLPHVAQINSMTYEEPIDWEYATYRSLLEALKLGLRDRFADVKDRKLQHIELVRPLFLDEVAEKAKTDSATREVLGGTKWKKDLVEKYEVGVPKEMKLSAQWLRDYCGFDVSLALEFEDQVGGDKVLDRSKELFWASGR